MEIENILQDINISVNQRFAVVIMQINKNYKGSNIEVIENDIFYKDIDRQNKIECFKFNE